VAGIRVGVPQQPLDELAATRMRASAAVGVPAWRKAWTSAQLPTLRRSPPPWNSGGGPEPPRPSRRHGRRIARAGRWPKWLRIVSVACHGRRRSPRGRCGRTRISGEGPEIWHPRRRAPGEMNVPDQFEEIRPCLDHDGPIPVLEQVRDPAVAAVEVHQYPVRRRRIPTANGAPAVRTRRWA